MIYDVGRTHSRTIHNEPLNSSPGLLMPRPPHRRAHVSKRRKISHLTEQHYQASNQ